MGLCRLIRGCMGRRGSKGGKGKGRRGRLMGGESRGFGLSRNFKLRRSFKGALLGLVTLQVIR